MRQNHSIGGRNVKQPNRKKLKKEWRNTKFCILFLLLFPFRLHHPPSAISLPAFSHASADERRTTRWAPNSIPMAASLIPLSRTELIPPRPGNQTSFDQKRNQIQNRRILMNGRIRNREEYQKYNLISNYRQQQQRILPTFGVFFWGKFSISLTNNSVS